ncbi:MAG TPA: M10 family metallopeptidase C-terminal domain-containing protein [Allosphingosinicella sp.]|nr:M10 family metallopeptidase C-terminal domain-containing protein [Allosphingosinicella sp.]
MSGSVPRRKSQAPLSDSWLPGLGLSTARGDLAITGTDDGEFLSGTAGDDTIDGRGGNDVIWGLEGSDSLSGGDGDDRIDGGDGVDGVLGGIGNDHISGGADGDYLFGEDGDDTLLGDDGDDRIEGGAGADGMVGGVGADFIAGGAGGDFLFGEAGDDTMVGDDGNDRLEGGAGSDGLSGGTGADYISGGTERDYLFGGAGADTITGDDGDDYAEGGDDDDGMSGGAGADRLIGGAGRDYVLGDAGDDFLVGGTDIDVILGGDGADTLIGEDGNDRLEGGAGADGMLGGIGADYLDGDADGDFLFGEDGGDTILGDDGDDRIEGGAGADGILGGAGADNIAGGADGDFLYGEDGGDTLLGQDGDDRAEGGAGADGILGGAGADYVAGGADGDFLFGEAGNDTVLGEDGDDYLDGGAGNDGLAGGAGADTFALSTPLGAGNVDFIADFTVNSDRILLAGDLGEPFAALAAGPLAAASFIIGTAAAQIDDYIIYNSATGALLYDADGNGAGAAVQVASLGAGLALTAAHFAVNGGANVPPSVASAASASIAENSAASTIVYQAMAADSQGDRVIWSLSGADAHRLTIDAVTGAVRLKASPDFEARPSYSFNVIASDSSASTVKAVTLNITDLGNEDSATTRIFETPSLNGDTSQAQSVTVFFNDIDTNPNLYNDDLPSIYILGSISHATDDDYFSISLSAGELLILDVDGAPGTLDALVRIYSSGGTLLAENDDTGVYDPGSLTPPGGHNKDSMLLYRVETSGTYYFSIESFEHDTSGSYKLNVSVGPSATPAQLFSQDVDALLSGLFWDRATPALTYGFPTLASQYPGTAFTEVNPASKFAPFTATQIDAVTDMLQTIANVSGLTFQRDTATPGQADLRFGMTTDGDPAYAYLPTNEGPESPGGSVWFNRTDFNGPVIGNYAWMGMLHETGHALGLKHSHETPLAVTRDRDSLEFTVMAYRSYPGQDLAAGAGYTNEAWGFPQTLMMLDIAALQRLYGANFGFRSDDTVYSWSPTTGEMSVNGVGQGRPGDSGNGSTSSSANRVFMTIWDGNGIDTYDMSAYAFGVRIDLHPGEWSRTSTIQLANLGGLDHMARGNVANALLYNGDTRSLIENAIGGAGGDRLIANQAANRLTGGAGNDTFQWKTGSDAGIGVLADRITDFLSGADKIDLGDVDSYSSTPSTNDTFTFIGTGAFTRAPNQLRYEVIGGEAHIFADLNANGVADFEIVLTNVTTLVSTDFIL